jgi:Bacterial regulatory proteins, tetR family
VQPPWRKSEQALEAAIHADRHGGPDAQILTRASASDGSDFHLVQSGTGYGEDRLDIWEVMNYDYHQLTCPEDRVMATQVKIKPDDTRARIMDTAEALFRRLGFAKTAVADIAAELKMSPANVYRFFPSRTPSSKRSASGV